MITLEDAKRIVHGQSLTSREQLLVLLAIEPVAPLSIEKIKERSTAVGLPKLARKNISDILAKSSGLVARTLAGWELQELGLVRVRELAQTVSINLIVTHSSRPMGPVQVPPPANPDRRGVHSAFIAQSFATCDKRVNECICDTLDALGVKVITGDRPQSDSISEKVKRLIEEQSMFVGIFTRRDKIARKNEWTTSSWVIDEKAYAVGRAKPLILLKEQGVGDIGGIQGDYEYIEFSRDDLESVQLRLIQLFQLTLNGLRK